MALKNNEVPANGAGGGGLLPPPPDGPVIIPGCSIEMEVLSVFDQPAYYEATTPLLRTHPDWKPALHQWRRFPKRTMGPES